MFIQISLILDLSFVHYIHYSLALLKTNFVFFVRCFPLKNKSILSKEHEAALCTLLVVSLFYFTKKIHKSGQTLWP